MKAERKKIARIMGVIISAAILSVLVLFSNKKIYLSDVKEVKAEKEENKNTDIVEVEDENSLSRLLKTISKDIIDDKKEQDRIDAEKEAARKKAEEEKKKRIVFDGLTMSQLTKKLDRNLKSTLKGQGKTFAKYSIQLGIDPYMAVAIVLHETGCSWNCSKLVRTCYNVGGMKGSPSCGGSYQRFNSLDAGIKSYMYNLYNNYYKQGLKTPEQINPKYAESTTWSTKIRQYMRKIRNS